MLKEIKIEYIYHSGFSLTFEDRIFIFDYYKGDLPELNKKTTFFVSHHHEDHYNEDIFNLENSNTYTYIISNDSQAFDREENIIKLGDEENIENLKIQYSDNTYYLNPGDVLNVDDYSVKTFGSTDQGLSLLVNYQGINIFHAGDLNLWIWDEDSQEERDQMYEDFMKIIDEISLYSVDIAFFPLDPRLEDRYADGFNIFIDESNPSIIFPMHFKDNISYNLQYLNDYKEYSKIFRPIFKNNQFFLVNYEG